MSSDVTSSAAGGVIKGFKNVQNVPISKEEMEEEYCKVTEWPYPITEIVFVRSWMVMRVSDQSCGVFRKLSQKLVSLQSFPKVLLRGMPGGKPVPNKRSCISTFSPLSGEWQRLYWKKRDIR